MAMARAIRKRWEYSTHLFAWDEATSDFVARTDKDGKRTEMEEMLNVRGGFGWELVTVAVLYIDTRHPSLYVVMKRESDDALRSQ